MLAIELPEDLVESLDKRSREEHVSREEVIRRAVAVYASLQIPSFQPKPAREPGPWPELDAVIGLWKDPDAETLEDK